MLGAQVRPAADSDAACESQLTAAVYYAGAWKGALMIECSTCQAMRWTALLMSLTPPVSVEDARDGLGDVTNMIAGNLQPLLPPGAGLSPPMVIDGANHRLRMPGGARRESVSFEDESGPFRVVLVQAS